MRNQKANLSPMMRQYLDIKDQYSDCILFFRLGDFYEMFFEDALFCSRELELVLTGKQCGVEEKAPMCGIPYHSASGYIAKLVEKGCKVAICEQTQDPSEAKGIVERDVVRIITPGTITDFTLLNDETNNYISSIFQNNRGVGMAFCDISTGELYVTEIIGAPSESISSSVINEIARYNPTEILFCQMAYKNYFIPVKDRFPSFSNQLNEEFFEFSSSSKTILEQFKSENIENLDFDNKPYAVCSLGALLKYFIHTQKSPISHIEKLYFYNTQEYMDIDASSRRNLELTATMREGKKRGSLLSILDKTKTSMGARLLKQWIEKPLMNPARIIERQLAVKELFENIIERENVEEVLKDIYDISRLISRVSLKSANPRDLISLRNSLDKLPQLHTAISNFKSPYLSMMKNSLDTMDEVKELLFDAIVDDPPVSIKDGGVINAGYSERIDEIRFAITNGKDLLTQIETEEKEKTGIKNLKISYNRVFGYYIEITKSNLNQVPDYYIRKQTLTNGERYITEKLKEVENLVLGSTEKIIRLEQHLYNQLLDKLVLEIERIKNNAFVVANIDTLCSLASVANDNGYTMPTVDLSNAIEIQDGRHPVVEKHLKNQLFVPNDTLLTQKDSRVAIITGPNMAGKSTYMRQVALICLMAQIGSFVPAKSAHIGIIDKIFTRVGASDDLSLGQSTFMLEMSEVANILANATSKSLLILDEIGRGTSTYDGLSIAWAVVEHVASTKKLGAKTLFATHYHELTQLENRLDGVKNYCIAVKKRGDEIIFLRKIIKGGADDSYGVEVAALAGVDSRVIKRAMEILEKLENGEVNKDTVVPKKSQEQITPMENLLYADIINDLKSIDATTMTPIEALSKLFEISNKAKNT